MTSAGQPRCYLSINGNVIPCIEASVTRKSKRAADTFRALLSITQTAQYGIGLAEWADFQPVDVSIIMSNAPGGGDQQVMITGLVDKPEIRWHEMTVEVCGRDKSASLTEKRRSQKFQNMKSSDIASQIAQDHGLTAAAVSSGDNAGKLFTQDTAHLVLNRSDYEVLSDLAEREGFRWYVDANTLYFEPKEQGSGTYVVTWKPPTPGSFAVSDAIELTTSRNMTAAKPHKVNVRSWHHHDKKTYMATAQADGVGDPIEFDHHHNGRTQDQVDKLSKSRLRNAKRHDCGITIRKPGDLSVNARMNLQLQGTGTIYDQLYDIDEVEFSMGWSEGFVMSIHCKAPKGGVQ